MVLTSGLEIKILVYLPLVVRLKFEVLHLRKAVLQLESQRFDLPLSPRSTGCLSMQKGKSTNLLFG